MVRKPNFQILPLLILTVVFLLSACAPRTASTAAAASQPTDAAPLATPTAAPTAAPSTQPYQNDALGFRLELPKDSQVSATSPSQVTIMAPGQGHPGQDRAAAFIFVEPANRRTVEQVVEAVKVETGPGFNISVSPLTIQDTPALVVSGLPGQDVNRQVFMVHGNQVYHLMFVPDTPQSGDAYKKMEEIYTAVVNSWQFVR